MRYVGDEQKIGSILLISYLVVPVAMPVWLAVWRFVSGSG